MKKKKRVRPIIELIFFILIGYLVFNYIKLDQKEADLSRKLELKEQEKNQIQEQISLAQEELSEENILKYIEKVARDEYGMLKPNEVRFKDQDNSQDKGETKN